MTRINPTGGAGAGAGAERDRAELESQEQVRNSTFLLLLLLKLGPIGGSSSGVGVHNNRNVFVVHGEQPAGHGASLNAMGRERSSVLGNSRIMATVS